MILFTSLRTSFIVLILTFFVSGSVLGQGSVGGGEEPQYSDGRQGYNLIKTGVPFLLIGPDSRSGAMGEAGAAIAPDANSIHWNPSKLAFIEDTAGLSLSYSPWLQRLVPDINLAYLSGFYRVDDRNVIGGSLRYFSLGEIQLAGNTGEAQGTYSPSEFAIDATFARQFGENFSLGTALRYIHSRLGSGQISGTQLEITPGSALAADVSAYLKKETVFLGRDARLALGLDISNIGSKIKYTNTDTSKIFLPTNFRLGTAATFLNGFNEFTVALDFNKLLVPTPPIRDVNGNIISGKDDNRSVPSAILGSFSDAPGGFSEELKEISYSVGLEYLYNHQFAIRAGYLYENPDKGDRQYLTLGAGLRYNIFNLDISYILADQQKSPMANTFRFTLGFNFK